MIVLQPLSIPVPKLEVQADTGMYDPLQGGISIGPCRVIDGKIFAGTLGVVVRDNSTQSPMLLSNFHVMCVDSQWHTGDTMTQPSRLDSGNCPTDIVGTLQNAVLSEKVDCAVSNVESRNVICSVVDIGELAGTAAAELNRHVRKRGRTTGLTHGTVETLDLTVEIDYGDGLGRVRLTQQIGIRVDASQSSMIGTHGDSGSIVVNDSQQVVGLYFAGSEDGAFGIANPIQEVLTALNVSICSSTTMPSAMAKGRGGEFKTPLKPELIESLKAETKDELKSEFKEHKNEKFELEKHKHESEKHKHELDKNIKNEAKEHHKEGKESLKAEWKESAIEKIPRFEGPEPFLGQAGAMAGGEEQFKTPLKPESKESLKAETKESLKAETKDALKSEFKEHKNEAKEHKNEFKEHHKEGKESLKAEWKESALEKIPRFEGPEPFLGQAGAMAGGEEQFKTPLKPESKESLKAETKESLKAETKDALKSEFKEHKNEAKEHKNEFKEHHKEGKESLKAEWKESAI